MRQSNLYNTPVGKKVVLGKMTVKVSLTTSGCNKCIFQKEAGARFCEFTSFCFAHNRSDKIPVKFVKVEE